MAIERMLTEELPARVLVARVLAEAGIEYVFGISGGHTGRIISGLSQVQNQVRMVTVREELLGGVMAEVYGRLTRKPGVMIGQGPWVLGNGLIGTLEAYLSSSPMVLLTDFSDAPHFQMHAPYQQATGDYGSWDARRAFGGVTKQVMQAQEPVAAVQATQLAIKHAMAGQPGPVAMLFSHDALAGKVAPDSQPALVPDPLLPAAAAAARRAGADRRGGERILAAGSRSSLPATGCASPRATSSCSSWRNWPGMPVATTAAGKGTFRRPIRWRSACSAPSAPPAANACMGEADLVLVVGSKLSPSDTAWENRKLLDPRRQIFVQIDIEPRNASWNFPAERSCSATRRRSSGGSARRCGRARTVAATPRSSASPATARRRAISTRRPISTTTSRSCRSG